MPAALTDEAETDLEPVIANILSGEYTYPVRIVCFNSGEGCSRAATSDVVDAVAQVRGAPTPNSRRRHNIHRCQCEAHF
ncbi:hypothetical protein NLM27_42415 [Bradyrhizobium sp. CCGB12]|uniref:hypothetical protein n=1 Tax=Bradyrhizobium sp. CCGB12 TaxID=2949632 RepID=UPI0020B299B3|nr:hypothetical protein [Bradyrhizobium sp. CCGB12]MCP3395378.1 hypothetical protein [Bradyrhizobium sp. CCGB12]